MSLRKILFRALLIFLVLAALLAIAGAVGLNIRRPPVRLEPQQRAMLLEVFGGEYLPDEPETQANEADMERRSFYVPMRDGVRIAVDVLLPGNKTEDARLPAVFFPTRYWRSWDLRFGLDRFLGTTLLQRMLVAHGYAVVLVDSRGSGASFGTRAHPWSADERKDYAELMDWAVAQPWCDGNLAAAGVSYVGTAAEFMALSRHPALKAVLPQFSLYDTYADIAFPGGVFNRWFVQNWGTLNRQLDMGEVPGGLGAVGELLVRGARPVPAPEGTPPEEQHLWGQMALEQAQAQHDGNVDIYKAARQTEFRDDVSPLAGTNVDGFSPHSFRAEAEAGNAAWYSWGGWHDGAYAASLLKRFTSMNTPQRAVIGPWNHGAVQDTSPFNEQDAEPAPTTVVQNLEQIRFLDHYLKGQGPQPENILRYYTMGEGVWKSSPTWPPPGFTPLRFYLAADNELTQTPAPQGADSAAELRADSATGSGAQNRWRTQLYRSDVVMPPRPVQEEGHVFWQSAPLQRPLEHTGEAILALELASETPDAAVFAYMEDVAPDGTVRYVTEAPFRLLNRKESQGDGPCLENVSADAPCHSFLREDASPLPVGEPTTVRFTLLPVSWLFQEGHRIRLVLAAADVDQFERIPQRGEAVLEILLSDKDSWLELPVQER